MMRSRQSSTRLLYALAVLCAVALFVAILNAPDPYWYISTHYALNGRAMSKAELMRRYHAGESLACVEESTGSLLSRLAIPELFICFDSYEGAQAFIRQQQAIRRRE
jgi:hypothetical protein